MRGAARFTRAHARGQGRHPAGVDSRSLPGDGPRRGRRLHRAGDQRPRDGLRHRPRGDPRRARSSTPAPSSSRSPAPRSATPSSARTSTRRSCSARRCAKGSRGPIFIQGDHVQTNAKKYNSPDRDKELAGLRALIQEEIAAGFYNIDIDTSTLVDLDKPTLDEQQEVNVNLAADFAAFIRAHEPKGVTVSVGGEIGEVGGKNSDVHELHAYMNGFNAALQEARRRISSASARSASRPAPRTAASSTPTARCGWTSRSISRRSRSCRAWRAQDYGLGGAVQHGASTLPPEAFDAFPKAGACEIHLATNFQNMVYEHPQFPAALKAEMYAWVRANATEERKPKDTEEQFIYKARKKAIGPFKPQMWGCRDDARRAIGQTPRGSVHVPDDQAEDQRHRGGGREVRQGAGGRRSTATPRSSPPAARSPRRRKKPKGSRTDVSRTTTRRRAHEVIVFVSCIFVVAARFCLRRASHHDRSRPEGRSARRDGHDLPRRVSRLHGRDGDAVRSEGIGAHARS